MPEPIRRGIKSGSLGFQEELPYTIDWTMNHYMLPVANELKTHKTSEELQRNRKSPVYHILFLTYMCVKSLKSREIQAAPSLQRAPGA